MVGRTGGWLHFLVEIELEMAKMPAFTNLKHCFFSTGYRSAGFLARLSRSVQAPSDYTTPIVFDKEEYDYGNNYNTSTGVYTVPYSGLYLIHVRVYGLNKSATHLIRVDGDTVTYTYEQDPDHRYQTGSTSIVLHLLAGQEVTVDPHFSGYIIRGDTSWMYTSFGTTFLYPD